MPNLGRLRRVLFLTLVLAVAVLCADARGENVKIESPSGRVVATVVDFNLVREGGANLVLKRR